MTLPSHSSPFGPPDRPELRNIRFHERSSDEVERWVWEPNATAWVLSTSKTRAEWNALAAGAIDPRPLTDAEIAHARRLAEEHGW